MHTYFVVIECLPHKKCTWLSVFVKCCRSKRARNSWTSIWSQFSGFISSRRLHILIKLDKTLSENRKVQRSPGDQHPAPRHYCRDERTPRRTYTPGRLEAQHVCCRHQAQEKMRSLQLDLTCVLLATAKTIPVKTNNMPALSISFKKVYFRA